MSELLRVLLVEDNPGDADLFKEMLEEKAQYEIETVSRLSEAFHHAIEDQFDIILLDLGLPDSSGFATLQVMRKQVAKLPIIVLTGMSDEQTALAAIKEGAQDYLIKGQTDASLLNRSIKYAFQRKQAEDKLRKSEGHLRTLVQTIPDLIWLKDKDGIYLSCNPMFERLFGAKEADIIGKTDYDFVEKELADFFVKNDRKAIAAGKPTTNEEWLTFADDSHRYLLETIKTPMFDDRGTLIGVLGIGHDISKRKQAEEEKLKLEAQLMQAQKMESVGRLAGGVAHDYNNMLTVILGYSELVLEKLDHTDPLREDLLEIRKAATRSMDITQQLLAFARKQIIAPVAFDLNNAVESILKMLRRLLGEDIDLNWLPENGLWPVKMDPSQLDQILANLCVNARDAIGGVGRITIETKKVVFDELYRKTHPQFVPGEYVLLTVSDDGCGMDTETVNKIFEPFFTTKGVGEGTGLGLATVYGIVEQNGGFIHVYSELGHGTTFKIYFSRHTDLLAENLGKIQQRIPRGNAETILVVEDDASILTLTQRILKEIGYTVLIAQLPSQGLQLIEKHEHKIDLLITDVVMPEMNGKELSERIYELYPGVKTLFMSGYTADAIGHRGILEQNIHFIQKPFSKENLAFKVKQVLDM